MALVVAETVVLSLGLNYGVHYASARLYDMFCVPHTFREVFQSLVTTASPVCSFLVNTIQVTQHNYAGVISTSVASALVGFLKP